MKNIPKGRERERETFSFSLSFGCPFEWQTIPKQKDARHIASLNELPDLHRIMTDHGI
jgi:hypothetical protein